MTDSQFKDLLRKKEKYPHQLTVGQVEFINQVEFMMNKIKNEDEGETNE